MMMFINACNVYSHVKPATLELIIVVQVVITKHSINICKILNIILYNNKNFKLIKNFFKK